MRQDKCKWKIVSNKITKVGVAISYLKTYLNRFRISIEI